MPGLRWRVCSRLQRTGVAFRSTRVSAAAACTRRTEKTRFGAKRRLRKLLAVASKEMEIAIVLALWTGQRQGDLLRLPWSAYDGKHIRLRQSKTGRALSSPSASR